MERLLVFADFDWLDKPELVGELYYECAGWLWLS